MSKSAALRAVLGEPGGVRGELAREDAREDRGEAEEGLGLRRGRLGGVRGAPLADQHGEGADRVTAVFVDAVAMTGVTRTMWRNALHRLVLGHSTDRICNLHTPLGLCAWRFLDCAFLRSDEQ